MIYSCLWQYVRCFWLSTAFGASQPRTARVLLKVGGKWQLAGQLTVFRYLYWSLMGFEHDESQWMSVDMIYESYSQRYRYEDL